MKRKLIFYIIVVAILLVGISFLAYEMSRKDKSPFSFFSDKKNENFLLEESSKAEIGKKEDNEDTITSEERKSQVYVNEKYGYHVSYPGNWYLNDEHANDEIKERGNNERMGGDISWSNYKIIEGKRNDQSGFSAVYLMIAKDFSNSIDEYVQSKGYLAIAERKEIKTRSGKSGFQYYSDPEKFELDGVSGYTTIFKKDDYFYVFNTGMNISDVYFDMVSSFDFE